MKILTFPSTTNQTSLQTSAPVAYRSASNEEPSGEVSMLASNPTGYIQQVGAPDEVDFEYIRSHFGDPRANVKPDDYYAFRMIASGDGLDSYFTKQDVETSFVNFVRDLKRGQSVLGSHQMATFSYGSSYHGEMTPADESRSEYEGTFYPQWDTPELRTKNWLVGKYFIPRGVTLNNQSSDSLIRSIELGAVRKASISFMVGQYVCGIDGHDLISTMFGPMPDEECSHFPGVAYDGQIAWALMKNNTLVETSLVYKNASPSSMLLRKAEVLAQRGSLDNKQIEQIENRFQVRLPRFERTVFNGVATTAAATTATTATNGITNTSYTIHGMEESDMAGRRRGGDDATRELAHEALTAEPEPEKEESAETEGEATADADATPTDATAPADESKDESPTLFDDSASEDAKDDDKKVDGEKVDAEADVEAEISDEASAAEAAKDDRSVAEDRHKGHTHAGEDKGGHKKVAVEKSDDEAVAETDPVTEPETTSEAAEVIAEGEAETEKEEQEPKSESTREEDVIESFTAAAEQLASALARYPDAFDSGQLSVAARAERAVDLALVDAGCDTTAGGHVARIFETRSRSLREALGEQLTVEAIRGLQAKATLGETLYEELVKDAVAARTGAQGDSFNAPKYRDLLMSARDVAYVKEEIESWKDAKKDRFSSGRSVVPRQITDASTNKDDRKTLPEAPIAITAKVASDGPSSNILEPRKNK